MVGNARKLRADTTYVRDFVYQRHEKSSTFVRLSDLTPNLAPRLWAGVAGQVVDVMVGDAAFAAQDFLAGGVVHQRGGKGAWMERAQHGAVAGNDGVAHLKRAGEAF